MPKKVFYLIGFILMLALLGFDSQAYAEQVNNSVKDCLEEPNSCGEDQVSPQNETNKAGTSSNQAHSDESRMDQNTVGLTIWDFFKMIMATVFVVALLYFVLKFVNKKNQVFKRSQIMENLGGVHLGSNKSLQIIKVGNRLLVVGVGENIQLLTEIEDGQEYRQILSEYNNKLDGLVQPNDLMAKVMRKVKEHTKSEHGAPTPPFQALLKKQLDDLAKERKKMYEEVEKSEGKDKQ